MALRLFKAFGQTPESWMQMQVNYELWRAKQHVNLERVHVIYAHAILFSKARLELLRYSMLREGCTNLSLSFLT